MAACPHIARTAPATSERVTHLSLGFPPLSCWYHEEGHLSAFPSRSWAPSSTAAHGGAAPHPLHLGLPLDSALASPGTGKRVLLCHFLPALSAATAPQVVQEGQV